MTIGEDRWESAVLSAIYSPPPTGLVTEVVQFLDGEISLRREGWEYNAHRPHLLTNACWCLMTRTPGRMKSGPCIMVRDFLTEETSDTAPATAEADLLR